MKCLLIVWVRSNGLKCPSVCLEIRAFLTRLLEGQLCPSPYTFLARQSHFHHLSQKSFEQKERDDIQWQTSNR